MSTLLDVAKLSRILTKENWARLALLKDVSRSFTETEEETLHLLMKENFPDLRAICVEEEDGLADNSKWHFEGVHCHGTYPTSVELG